MAERMLNAEYGDDLVDHRTYVLASDGDLMEGISQEAIALAGHLKLSRLIVLFDDNGISIDGPLSLSDSVDQVKRFEAAGWRAVRVDGHDPQADRRARSRERAEIRPPDDDRLQDHHRLRRAEEGRHLQGARRAARGRGTGRRQGVATAGRIEPFEIPDDDPRRLGEGRRAGSRRSARPGPTALKAAPAATRSRVRAPHERRAAGRSSAGRRRN